MSAEDPVLRVVAGTPTEEELVAVLLALRSRTPAAAEPALEPSRWAAPWRSVHAPLMPAPGAWAASGRPA